MVTYGPAAGTADAFAAFFEVTFFAGFVAAGFEVVFFAMFFWVVVLPAMARSSRSPV